MSERRAGSGSPGPAGEDTRDSDGHYGFVDDRYSSSELGDPIHSEVNFDRYSDSEDEDEDEELTDNVSDNFPSLFGSESSLTDLDDEEDNEEDGSEAGQLGEAPREYIFVDTQYMPPEGPGEGPIIIGDTQYMPPMAQEEYGPIVIGDTQMPMAYEEDGPIVIGDTQMPDSSAIEIATSPIRAVHDSAGMAAAGEGSVRRDLKHRMSNASEDETSDAAADNKKRKADDNSDKVDEGTKSPVPPPPPTLRTRTQFKCAVCLETPDPAVFVHPCGHVFCEGCAQGAVQTTGKCPVCRHAMRARNIRVLQFRIAPIGRVSK
ncbi:hypothetical protein GGI09_008647 [Coemansia sp. S100]|nr:hypothetical protein LPJ71_007222 [Coemansia sp. S17]KAJ2075243.1 hypothetical protein GGI09_008647 [Coemansia sp. S100]